MAEVHAVFYLSSEPLDAVDIGASLSISRSNISTSFRELEVSPLHKPVTEVNVRGQIENGNPNAMPMPAFGNTLSKAGIDVPRDAVTSTIVAMWRAGVPNFRKGRFFLMTSEISTR